MATNRHPQMLTVILSNARERKTLRRCFDSAQIVTIASALSSTVEELTMTSSALRTLIEKKRS
jgi:hypothetical protein